VPGEERAVHRRFPYIRINRISVSAGIAVSREKDGPCHLTPNIPKLCVARNS
jgi:hypothetical protein